MGNLGKLRAVLVFQRCGVLLADFLANDDRRSDASLARPGEGGSGIFRIFEKRKDALELAMYGIFGVMFCQYSYLRTIQSSDAGTATVLQYLSPVLVILWVCLRRRQLPSGAQAVAAVSALVGTFLVATGGQIGKLAISRETFLWGMIAAVSMSAMTLLPRGLLLHHDATTVGAFGMFLGGIVLFLAVGRRVPTPPLDLSMIAVIAVILSLGTVVAFTLYLRGIAMIGSVRAGMAATVEPVAATLISAIFLRTVFTATDAVGFALIIVTVFLANRPGGVRG